jgi:hypothetical protein
MLSMILFLSCVSLPVPCQALGRERKFPATLRRFTTKPLILLDMAPKLKESSRYFPAGRENCDAPEAARSGSGGRCNLAGPARSSTLSQDERPSRPTPGSFRAGDLNSKPIVRPRKLSSIPSRKATSRPAMPNRESCNPVPLGAVAKTAPPGRKSLPFAFAGSARPSSGTERPI